MTADVLAARLGARRCGPEWRTHCPIHGDEHPSLEFRDGDRGLIFTCRSKHCDSGAIAAHYRAAYPDLSPPREGTVPGGPKIVATYDYVDEMGELLFQVVRYEPKDFRQRRPDGRGGWLWSLGDVARVLFRLPKVLATAKAGGVVYVVEGEKDVASLEALGLTATTNAGGAGKWRPEFAEAFKGCKGVVVVPDNDEPGRKHVQDVARSVHAVGVPVKVVELPELPAKGDVSDWLVAGGTKAALVALASAAPRWEPAHDTGSPMQMPEAEREAAVLVRVSTVKPERVEWLWTHRMPRGKLTVLDGDPGLGKSTLTLDLAARLTRGRPMPGDERETEPAGVVLLTAEDGIADTIRPRLEAAGADLDRVAVLTAVRDEKGRPRPPVIPEDVEAVGQAVRKMGARLVVVDPLMAFLNGRLDSHRDQDVRGALALLADLAEREEAAVIIIRHLNKTMGGHPIYRGGGSIGIIGAARAGLLVAPDPKDETRRVLAVSKSNLGPIPPSLSYKLVQHGDVSVVEWLGIADSSAKDLLVVQAGDGDPGGARARAEDFLRELLADGPIPAKDAWRQAGEAGITNATLRRAKDRLSIVPTKAGGRFGGDPSWYWRLPQPLKVLTLPEDAHVQMVSTFSSHEHLQPEEAVGPETPAPRTAAKSEEVVA